MQYCSDVMYASKSEYINCDCCSSLVLLNLAFCSPNMVASVSARKGHLRMEAIKDVIRAKLEDFLQPTMSAQCKMQTGKIYSNQHST
jgi:hypothetical protein